MTTSRKLLEEVLALADGPYSDERFGDLVLRIRYHLAEKRETTTRFVKPTPQEVEAYAREISFRLDGGKFCDFYESKGWKVGKTPMKDWRAAVRTWKRGSGSEKQGFGY